MKRRFRHGALDTYALRGVDLTVHEGEFLAVMGPSGSGKSTLLHLLGGLDRPDAGEVLLEQRSLADLDEASLALLRRRRIGFVLQFFNLMPTLTALENVAFPLALDGVRSARSRAEELLTRVGLAGRAAHRPHQLSGGEQQRVALARALVASPAIVLADEPTGNLDTKTGAGILALIGAIADSGQTVVMVTHSQAAADASSRVVRLVDGEVVEDVRRAGPA